MRQSGHYTEGKSGCSLSIKMRYVSCFGSKRGGADRNIVSKILLNIFNINDNIGWASRSSIPDSPMELEFNIKRNLDTTYY
jgi:hypothetical protein